MGQLGVESLQIFTNVKDDPIYEFHTILQVV